MASFAKRADDQIPYCHDQGMPYLTGAAKAGVSLQAKQKTLSGAAPHVFTFATEGFEDMANTAYAVFVGGETVSLVTVDQSTITATGFSILGGLNAEVVHVQVVGVLKGQASV